MKRRLIGLALAATVAASGAPLRAQSPAAPVTGAAQSEADALVRLLFPAGMVDLEVSVARRAFFAGLAADPDGRRMVAAYPGIEQALWEAIAPEIRADFETRLPQLWPQLSAMYRQRLAPSEIEGLRHFFQGATGQKLLRTMFQQMDPEPMIRDLLERRDGTVSAEAAAQVTAKVKARTAASLQASITAEDAAAYGRLEHVISKAKADAVSAEAQKMALAWANAPNPEREAKVAKIAQDTAMRYTATHKRAE